MGDVTDRVGTTVPTAGGRPSADASGARHMGGATGLVVVGAVCGLAWAAGLRGMMSEIAGSASVITWGGTFVWILLPGVVTGALLGWAEHIRRTGGRRGWRWLALSPLTFAAVVMTPDGMRTLLEEGLGGGALMVPLVGIAGGYALSGRGPAWGRIAGGALAVVPLVIWVLIAESAGGAHLALDMPRGGYVAIYLYSYLAVLAIACTIPHRPVAIR